MAADESTENELLLRAERSSRLWLGAGTLALLPPHASTRRYVRWSPAGQGPPRVGMILPRDLEAADEKGGVVATSLAEEPFVVVQRWLDAQGVRVPAVLALDVDEHMLWLEDVGDLDLDGWLARDRPDRVEAYLRVLETLRGWQRIAPDSAPPLVRERVFDRAMIAWELEHYRVWRVEDDLGVSLTTGQREVLDRAFARLTDEVAALPTGLMHRDFQSHNLMVLPAHRAASSHPPIAPDAAKIVVLDFQDAMIGPRVYDLVALLRDSYVELTPGELDALLDAWVAPLAPAERDATRRAFHLQTLQRKLKDAGRFVYIDRVRGRSNFLRYVPGSVRYVREALHHLTDYSDLRDVLAQWEPEFRERQ